MPRLLFFRCFLLGTHIWVPRGVGGASFGIRALVELESTSWMAPKKNRKQAQETMLEEPTENQIVPSESIGEKEPKARKDQDEPESEEE